MFRRVLDGEAGAPRDAVLLNAGAGIAAHAGQPGSLVERLAAGIEQARDSIDSGRARDVLARWAAATEELVG